METGLQLCYGSSVATLEGYGFVVIAFCRGCCTLVSGVWIWCWIGANWEGTGDGVAVLPV